MSECEWMLWSRGCPGPPGVLLRPCLLHPSTAPSPLWHCLAAAGQSDPRGRACRPWVPGQGGWNPELRGGGGGGWGCAVEPVSSPCPVHPLLPQFPKQREQAILPPLLCLPLDDSLPPPELHLQPLPDACRAAQPPEHGLGACRTP